MSDGLFMKYTFNNFAEMVKVLRGWNIDIKQLKEGKIYDTLMQLKMQNIYLAYGEFSGLTHQTGEIPPGRTFAFYTGEDSKLIWRKKELESDLMMIFPLNSKLDVVIKGSKTFIHTINVSEEHLMARLQEDEQQIYKEVVSKELLFMKKTEMNNLKEIFYKYTKGIEDNPDIIHEKNFEICLEEEVFSALINILFSNVERDFPETKDRIIKTWNNLESYIETNKNRPIMLSELGQAVGIGERSLYRLFNERFGMPPKAYLNKLRLNGVRKDLGQISSTEKTITQVANDWGYWHMGQFAADYKHLFGELPSETLTK